MYQSHFGLTERPFREALDPATFVELPSRVATLRRLVYGLEHAGGPALLFGSTGSGKSILSRRLAAIGPYEPVFVDYPAMSAEALLAYIAEELVALPRDLAAELPDLARSVRAVRAALTSAAARGARPLLVVDDAHLINDGRALDALRLLLNFNSGAGAELRMLLVGEPDLALGLPAALADRLSARCLLRPLELNECVEYVTRRLSHAGAAVSPFDPSALTALHAAAEGLPRRINRLADLALLVAAAEGRTHIDAALIDRLAADELPDPLAA